MGDVLDIVRALDAPERFAQWRALPAFAAIDAHPLTGGFARAYYPLVYGASRHDESFALVAGGMPMAIVLCTRGEDVIDYFGQPAAVFLDMRHRVVLDAVFDHLAGLAGPRGVTLRDRAGGESSLFDEVCGERGFAASDMALGLCDLTAGEDGLRRELRKSYRSLVNWGRREMRSVYINGGNPDRAAFDLYQALHLGVAGRSTRPQSTWDAMFDWIAGGRGELVLGFLQDELVAGTMIVDGDSIAYYASGVYDRASDKPLGHWPVFDAIVRSGRRGLRWMEMGDLPAPGQASEKERNIGHFKRGFTTNIETMRIWRRQASGSPPRDPADHALSAVSADR